jgi:hypothetical protein
MFSRQALRWPPSWAKLMTSIVAPFKRGTGRADQRREPEAVQLGPRALRCRHNHPRHQMVDHSSG